MEQNLKNFFLDICQHFLSTKNYGYNTRPSTYWADYWLLISNKFSSKVGIYRQYASPQI